MAGRRIEIQIDAECERRNLEGERLPWIDGVAELNRSMGRMGCK